MASHHPSFISLSPPHLPSSLTLPHSAFHFPIPPLLTHPSISPTLPPPPPCHVHPVLVYTGRLWPIEVGLPLATEKELSPFASQKEKSIMTSQSHIDIAHLQQLDAIGPVPRPTLPAANTAAGDGHTGLRQGSKESAEGITNVPTKPSRRCGENQVVFI